MSLTVALSKGKLLAGSEELFRRAGLAFPNAEDRKLVVRAGELRFLFVKDMDVLTYVEYVVTGAGEPVTLFVHGLTGSVAQTRPFGSGVAGTRVFAHLRGHGLTAVPQDGPGTYADLAGEVL